MTTKIFKKVGRRYVEIGTYDPEFCDYYPHGASLVFSRPGSRMTRFKIDPANAAVLAAIEPARDAMIEAMRQASVMRPAGPLKGNEKRAWEAYKAIAGETVSLRLEGASTSDIIDAGIAALRARIDGGK